MLKFVYMQKSKGSQAFTFNSHTEYEILYIHSGTGTYLIGDKIYPIVPGDLIIMHGMTLHRANPDPSVEYCRSYIMFDPQLVEGIIRQSDMVDLLLPFRRFGHLKISIEDEQHKNIELLFNKMHTMYHEQRLSKERIIVAFLELLVDVYDEVHCIPFTTKPASEKEDIVREIMNVIEHHYFEDINPTFISETLHLSKFYISRIFKEMTGVTIMDYVMNRRINQAKILFLLDAGISVTEVGERVGFKYLAHFSRVFKQKIGKTPDQYRKSI